MLFKPKRLGMHDKSLPTLLLNFNQITTIILTMKETVMHNYSDYTTA